MITKTLRYINHFSNQVTKRSITNKRIIQIFAFQRKKIYSNPHCSHCMVNRISYNFVNIPITSKYYNSGFPSQLDLSMDLARKQDNLNEKIDILEHITQLVQKNPKFVKYDLDKFMIKELSKWKNGRGRFQKVATVAWIINKLKLKDKLRGLFDQIIERIANDEWYVNFDEGVKAIEAYADYEDKNKRNQVFEKIQRNLNISLNDVNMTYYQRICQSLMEAERDKSPIWDKIQNFVLRNLSMEYSPKTFFDIFKAFAITRNGSLVFYEVCQEVIHKGHLYNQTSKLRNNLGDFDSTGDYFAMMIQTYAIVTKYSPFLLEADFLDYIYKSMLASRVEYKNISSLTKIVNYMPQLQFLPQQVEKVVNDVINNKEFTQYHSFADIQQLYFALQNKLGVVPEKLRKKVELLVRKDLERNLLPLPKAIESVQFLLVYQNEKEAVKQNTLIQQLNKAIQRKFKYLEPQQSKLVIQMLKESKQLQHRVNNQILLPKPIQQQQN